GLPKVALFSFLISKRKGSIQKLVNKVKVGLGIGPAGHSKHEPRLGPTKIKNNVTCHFSPGRFHAFEMEHKLDSTSAGQGVPQFKTAPLRKLEKILKYALEVEKIREQYVPYNILPLHAVATTPPIMNVPEIGEVYEQYDYQCSLCDCRLGLPYFIRGMMYYRWALALQCFLDMADDCEILGGNRQEVSIEKYLEQQNLPLPGHCRYEVHVFVVSCQVYGQQKKSSDSRDKSCSLNILNLMEIYRIKLPGSPIICEGKPENQNHAIIFTRGEALQTIDMNKDNHLEEAFKMRNCFISCMVHVKSRNKFCNYWTASFSKSAQVIVRFHYGHPDIFDRIFHLTRGGISKASEGINLSEDIFR
ncbi:Callose synthase 7, partial [Nymphaea thermarum]